MRQRPRWRRGTRSDESREAVNISAPCRLLTRKVHFAQTRPPQAFQGGGKAAAGVATPLPGIFSANPSPGTCQCDWPHCNLLPDRRLRAAQTGGKALHVVRAVTGAGIDWVTTKAFLRKTSATRWPPMRLTAIQTAWQEVRAPGAPYSPSSGTTGGRRQWCRCRRGRPGPRVSMPGSRAQVAQRLDPANTRSAPFPRAYKR